MNPKKLDSKNRNTVKNCPCGKSNDDGKFVPFEGCTKFGYCHSCSKLINSTEERADITWNKSSSKKEAKIIPYHYLLKTIRSSSQNNFISFLVSNLGREKAEHLCKIYKVGTSKQWYGASIFWYVDKDNNTRTGKIMLYNKITGKRIKEPYNHITWVHKKLHIPNDSINSCLFGEHLISLEPNKPIAIVESEKTAMISSVYFDKFIWLATGGIANLKYDKLKSLKGRDIILFPDLGAYDLWVSKTNYLKKWFKISISNFLEKNATNSEKAKKYDLADYLIQLNH